MKSSNILHAAKEYSLIRLGRPAREAAPSRQTGWRRIEGQREVFAWEKGRKPHAGSFWDIENGEETSPFSPMVHFMLRGK